MYSLHMVLFFNVKDVSAHHTFVLWTAVDPNWDWGKHYKRKLFLEELGRELVVPLINRRQVPPRTPASASLVTEIQPGASTSAAHHPGGGAVSARLTPRSASGATNAMCTFVKSTALCPATHANKATPLSLSLELRDFCQLTFL